MVETGQSKAMIEQTIADAKMNALMSQAMDQKNSIIKALQRDLEAERKQRRDVGKEFSTSLKEFNEERKQLARLKAKADKLERKEQERQKEIDAELDQVPTNMKKATKLQEHPIFFKGSRIESSLPKEQGMIRRKGKAQTASK